MCVYSTVVIYEYLAYTIGSFKAKLWYPRNNTAPAHTKIVKARIRKIQPKDDMLQLHHRAVGGLKSRTFISIFLWTNVFMTCAVALFTTYLKGRKYVIKKMMSRKK